MSEKKPQLNEEAQDEPSSIEIVTVGIKHGHTQIIHKEHPHPQPQVLNPPPSPPLRVESPAQEPLAEEEAQVSHTNLGDKENEEKIREHVEGMLQQIEAQQENVQSRQESGQESNGDEQEENSSRSDRESGKKGGARSNYESNDQRREDGPSSRRCFNKQCSSKKIYKKIRSRVEENKYRFFCKTCYENYSANSFCQFCEQIYSVNCDNEDDDKWIGCDLCDRWNHIECEKKFRDKNISITMKDKNEEYYCLACTQKTKASDKTKKAEKEEEKATIKQKLEINKDLRIPIFNKKIEPFPNLEYFLQNYSFRLWMNEGQIREDLEHLRSACLKNGNIEDIAKKGKKVKTQ